MEVRTHTFKEKTDECRQPSLFNFRAANPNHYEDRWVSSKIVERKASNILMTNSTPYVLEGKLSIIHAQEHTLPLFIRAAFKV